MSEVEWLQLRNGNIGSTDVPALFGLSSWSTLFMVWQMKRGGVNYEFQQDDIMEAGKRLEPVIAHWAADKMNWTAHPTDFYVQHDKVKGMGCSLDFYVNNPERGDGLIECKNRNYWTWKDKWTEDRMDPEVYLQVQAQFACTGWEWGVVACLVGGFDLKLYPVERNEKVINEIERRVEEFWEMPCPDPTGTAAESKLITEMFPAIEREFIESEDMDLLEKIRLYKWACEQRASHDRAAKSIKPIFQNAIGDAEALILPGITLRQSISSNKRRTYTIKENDRQPEVPETTILEG